MASEADKDQKTETASQHKLRKSREAGQVARSQDLSGMSGLIAAIFASAIFLPHISREISILFVQLMQDVSLNEISVNGIQAVLVYVAISFAKAALPVLLITWLATFIATTAQVGFQVSFKPLEPNLDKVNPINGFQRLFSMRSTMATILGLIKMLLVILVAGSVLWNNRHVFITMNFQDLPQILKESGAMIWEISLKAAMTLLVLGLVDYIYQRWQYNDDQKMTKQEVKDEYKQLEGNPFLKGQIKARQRSFSQKRGLKESVKMADVVVTNPFHIAVAIKYDRSSSKSAPIVVAKGARLLAERIKEFARESGIDIIQNIPVARALYKKVGVDREISPELYIAVAEVLAIVYSKKNKKVKL